MVINAVLKVLCFYLFFHVETKCVIFITAGQKRPDDASVPSASSDVASTSTSTDEPPAKSKLKATVSMALSISVFNLYGPQT